MMCDGCPNVVHFNCAGLDVEPTDDEPFVCGVCAGEHEADEHVCYVCTSSTLNGPAQRPAPRAHLGPDAQCLAH